MYFGISGPKSGNSKNKLFTLIIRNVQLDNSITRDAQKYLNKKKQQPKK